MEPALNFLPGRFRNHRIGKLVVVLVLVSLAGALTGCSSFQPSVMSHQVAGATSDGLTLMWYGTGQAWRHVKGEWQRSAADDYVFEVVQKRLGSHWESVKIRHYLSPEYKGSAGDGDQSLFFRLDYSPAADGLAAAVSSTLGPGTGTTDKEFREAGFTLVLPEKPFWPYNRFRITQHYHYETGELIEQVELFMAKDGGEIPFMKMEEKAAIYRQGSYTQAPTVWK